jgi:AraC-like DNA-binding protein
MARSTKASNLLRQPDALSPALSVEDGPILPAATGSMFLGRMYALLVQHQADPSMSVSRLAHQLAINRKTLYRKVQQLTNQTPTDLIRQYRLQQAAELLRMGHTVTKTAVLSGFKTPSHFATVFKEYYQQTPTEFVASQGVRAEHQ